MASIHVDEAALNALKNALETAGQDYKQSLARLTSLIEEITSGDIQGDPANNSNIISNDILRFIDNI